MLFDKALTDCMDTFVAVELATVVMSNLSLF